jgi:hypothetical protein
MHWSFQCVSHLTRVDPEALWPFILAAVPKLTTRAAVAYFSAGPPEDLISRYGPAFIDRIEAEARRSPRFKFVLTGVWAQGKQNTAVWKRIEVLQASGPKLDNGDPLPDA